MFARNTVQISRRALSTSTRVHAVPNTSATGNPSPHSAPFPGQKDPRDFNPKDTAWKQRKQVWSRRPRRNLEPHLTFLPTVFGIRSAFMGISPVYAAFGTIGILATGAFVNYSMKDNSHERPRTGVPHSDELKEALKNHGLASSIDSDPTIHPVVISRVLETWARKFIPTEAYPLILLASSMCCYGLYHGYSRIVHVPGELRLVPNHRRGQEWTETEPWEQERAKQGVW
ncbi:hypothetical protein JCM3766R1_002060 [Sporobolomyces carnicolor]